LAPIQEGDSKETSKTFRSFLNPPDVKGEPKLDFKSYMNSPLQSSKPKINLNLPEGSVGAIGGGAAGAFIGYNINRKDHKEAKEICTALSQDCFGNKRTPPAAVKQNLNKQRLKTGAQTLLSSGIGASGGWLIDKITRGQGLNIGNFRLKIGG